MGGDLAPAVSKLKAEIDGEILVAGSRSLVQGLLANGLVDELRLIVFPVALGSGKRLFAETDEPLKLALHESRSYDSGTLLLTYGPA